MRLLRQKMHAIMNNGKTIAEYKNRKWTNVGELEKIRFQTRSITFGGQAMIFDLEKKLTTFERPPVDIFPGFGVFLIQKDFCT